MLAVTCIAGGVGGEASLLSIESESESPSPFFLGLLFFVLVDLALEETDGRTGFPDMAPKNIDFPVDAMSIFEKSLLCRKFLESSN